MRWQAAADCYKSSTFTRSMIRAQITQHFAKGPGFFGVLKEWVGRMHVCVSRKEHNGTATTLSSVRRNYSSVMCVNNEVLEKYSACTWYSVDDVCPAIGFPLTLLGNDHVMHCCPSAPGSLPLLPSAPPDHGRYSRCFLCHSSLTVPAAQLHAVNYCCVNCCTYSRMVGEIETRVPDNNNEIFSVDPQGVQFCRIVVG